MAKVEIQLYKEGGEKKKKIKCNWNIIFCLRKIEQKTQTV